jgi:hypothetical protein
MSAPIMNAFLDDFLVGAVLLASIGYAVFRLGPKNWRRRILEVSSGALKAAPAALKLGGLAQRLETASGKNQAACGGCDNCGAESASTPQSSGEISVPIAKIGRRA